MARKKKSQEYGLTLASKSGRLKAPLLPYRPCSPSRYQPAIGLIACGGITEQHLRAYSQAGYRVVALCDLTKKRAEKRRAEFYPEAQIYTDYRKVLKRDDIEVVDIATHPPERVEILEAAIQAGKHILSQKPFVLDLDVGRRLVDLADQKGIKLAVNQNGRWAPHWSYIRQAVGAGILGEVLSAEFSVNWNHNWVAGSTFDRIHHLILYDFAIHWFDIATVLFGERAPRRVSASLAYCPNQKAKPPLLAQASVEYDKGQAMFAFNGNCLFGQRDSTRVIGSRGTFESQGPSLSDQKVVLSTEGGSCSPRLRGTWFPDGFHGTMGELLCAIEENREPTNSARKNLRSLALCFAAAASADDGKPKVPGRVKKIESVVEN